jgi:hypothetical protein
VTTRCGEDGPKRNPMELVTIRGAMKRRRQRRSVKVEEFRLFAQKLATCAHAPTGQFPLT